MDILEQPAEALGRVWDKARDAAQAELNSMAEEQNYEPAYFEIEVDVKLYFMSHDLKEIAQTYSLSKPFDWNINKA